MIIQKEEICISYSFFISLILQQVHVYVNSIPQTAKPPVLTDTNFFQQDTLIIYY